VSPERIPALDELRENLREAAQRDVAAAAPRLRRRRRRRAGGVLAVALLGVAAAAGAGELISAGEPVQDDRAVSAAYFPDGSRIQIDGRAADPDRRETWVVGVYRARNGQKCAIAGQLRGAQMGTITNGVFHAYGSSFAGTCGKPGTLDLLRRRSDRTVVYGFTRPGTRVTATYDGPPALTTAGPHGAWLFVYEGRLSPTDVRIEYG
jgi:hypothetical protein